MKIKSMQLKLFLIKVTKYLHEQHKRHFFSSSTAKFKSKKEPNYIISISQMPISQNKNTLGQKLAWKNVHKQTWEELLRSKFMRLTQKSRSRLLRFDYNYKVDMEE
jgi:hypothetical protein